MSPCNGNAAYVTADIGASEDDVDVAESFIAKEMRNFTERLWHG
jgi:hypothetical protein